MSSVSDNPHARRMKVDEEGYLRSFLNSVRDRVPSGMSYRELTHNAIQAYLDNGLEGEVVWFHELDPSDERRGRWGIRDTACGMSYREIEEFMGALHSTGGELGTGAGHNYGIGAKLSCLKDHERTRWVTLKNGKVSWFEMWIEGGFPYFEAGRDSELLDELHESIRAAGHGTQVTFPQDAFETRSKLNGQRLVRRLSQRYHRLPSGLQLKVENWTPRSGRGLYTVDPQGRALEGLSEIQELFSLLDGEVVAEVWILRETDADAKKKFNLAGLYRDGKPIPRSATVLVDESRGIEESYGSTQGAHNRIRRSGFRAGWKRVHLIWKPDPARYITHEDRSGVRPKTSCGEDSEINWDRWTAALYEAVGESAVLQEYIRSQEKTPAQEIDRLRLDFAKFVGILARATDAGGSGDDSRATGRGGGEGTGGRGGGTRRNTGSGGRRHGGRVPKIKWIGREDEDFELLRGGPAVLIPEGRGRYTLELNQEWPQFLELRERLAGERNPFGVGSRGEVVSEEVAQAALEMLGLDLVFRHDRESRGQPDPEDFAFGLDTPLGLRSVATEYEKFRAGKSQPAEAEEEPDDGAEG